MAFPIYNWQHHYLQAVQETDDAKMPYHLMEAIAAIEQRLLSPIEKDSLEYRAIENTRRGIEVLRKERCGWTGEDSPVTHHEQPRRSATE